MRELIPFPEGVDGSTGELVTGPGTEEVSQLLEELRLRQGKSRAVFGDPYDLSDVGWGLVFAQADSRAEELKQRLQPLLRRRSGQAGQRFRIFQGDDGYRAGEDKVQFLARHNASLGPVEPERLPYYLLLVGNPAQIPYSFQYALDLHHAVGRIHFEADEAYTSYAEGVIAAEEASFDPNPRLALFGPRQDEGTQLSVEHLLTPLGLSLSECCRVEECFGDAAKKELLVQLTGGDKTPRILFTAGHGLLYRSTSPHQRPLQGALVCQDWPGPQYGPPDPGHVFAAADVGSAARLQGLLAFFFACYSAGTPERDDFAHDGTPGIVADNPFVSSLAQQMLARGALAVVGHVERVWRCSFLWRDTGSQIGPFAECLKRFVEGAPLGWALEPINQRYADFSASLRDLLENYYLDAPVDKSLLSELWMATHDARNYVVVGDPAVRLPSPAVPPPKKPVLRGSA